VEADWTAEELTLEPVTGPTAERFDEVENPLLIGPGAVVRENEYDEYG